MLMQRAHFNIAFFGVFHGMMRMHAGSGVQEAGMRLGQLQGFRRTVARCAGDHDARNTGFAGTRQDIRQVVIETFMAQVGADIE